MPCEHLAQFYWDAYDLVETLVPYFATGLAAHERCIWICAPPLCAPEARAALAKVVGDLASFERSGQIEIRDHETLNEPVQHWLDAEREALASGYGALRIAINCWDANAAHEARLHAALRRRRIHALCSYSLARCEPAEIGAVLCHHHCAVVRDSNGWQTENIDDTTELGRERVRRQVIEAAYASARDAREHLVLLNRLTGALGEVTTRAHFIELVREKVMQALEANGLAVVEIRDNGEHAPLLATGCAADALCRAPTPAPGHAMWSSEVAALAGMAAQELESFAVVPMVVAGRKLAQLVLGYDSRRELSASYRALVEDVARQLALALDRAISYERLEQERARAESASRAKDEFLAMLGHELRNPLSPILTATQLMRLRGEHLLEKERTVIERQVNHMIRLVDDLLDVSRITRGKVELRRRAVEISEVVATAVELASPAMEQRAHRLTIDVSMAGLVVYGDPHRLAQVIANLLTNAAKYTPHGGSIQLLAKATDKFIRVVVRDTGIGIDTALLPHVFSLFVQGRQGIDRASGGLGLGLAIAKTIVELHGGTISASSDGEGKGTELTVMLPRHARKRIARGLNNSGAFALVVTRPLSVLVVDDNEDAAFLFSEALKKLGHSVDVAHDGPSALTVARERPPQIAFLDIGLPVMDGYELGRRLREQSATAPKLVAVTGYGHTSDRVRSREAGFDLHLVKPVDLVTIQDALAKLGT